MINIENVRYISVWDGGFEVATNAKYNNVTKEVFDIESSNIDDVGVNEGEYIELLNGKRLEVEHRENGYFAIK